MGAKTKKLVARSRKLGDRVEAKLFETVGRRVVRRKVREAKEVTRRAAVTGLVVGAVTAADVVAREIRKRRG